MSRISRYVFREILGPTLLGLLVFGVVLFMPLMLQAAELYIRRDLPLLLVGEFLLLALPRILVLVIPMAVLLGVLVGVGRISADSELTALRACGYSDRRLLVPVLLLGTLASVICAVLFHVAVPAANYAQHQLNAQIFLSSDINREIRPRVFYERIPDMLIYADAADPSDGLLRRVIIYQKAPAGGEELSTADVASLRQDPSEKGAIEFRLKGVKSHSWKSREPDLYQVSRSDTQVIDRPPDLLMQEMVRSLSAPPPRNLREQTVPELYRTLADLESRGDDRITRNQVNETWVEIHKKFSLPATSFVFALFALPLALGHRRTSSRTWGFVVSIVVISLSYTLLTAGEHLADQSVIPPALGMWAGNILFAILGLAMILTGQRFDLNVRRRGRRRARRKPSEVKPTVETANSASPSPAPLQRRVPSTIDRYLLRHLLIYSTFVGLLLVVLFTLFYAVDLLDDLTRNDRSFSLMLSYLLCLQPQIVFGNVAPISLCIGTLITFALLARNHELTAMKAGGVGLFRSVVPFIVASAVVGGLSFVAHDAVLPYTNQKANKFRDEIRNRSARSYRQPERRWVFGSQGLLFNFSDFNPRKQEFQELAIFRFRPGTFDIEERVFAARAGWRDDSWVLESGWVRRFDADSEQYAAFDSQTRTDLDPPEYFSQDWKAPDQMNYGELSTYVNDLERRGYDTRELRVGLYRKIAIPAVCVVMVIVGLPFALRVERRGPVFAIGVSVLLVFLYVLILQAFGKAGEVALMPPMLAAWGPNLLFTVSGLYMTSTARW